ncbi:MAG TPA: hypothetical protein VI958_05090 [Acidobacteriota bacterium]
MKSFIYVSLLCCLFMAGIADAQEHWTEGPVWECGAYRTKDGQFDNYMNYLRENYLPQSAENKKQGLFLDSKIFVQSPTNPNDWDVLICTLYPSFGKAMDYNADDDAKAKATAEKHWKTADQQKQREMSANRFEMRTFLGVTHVREVTLRPMK